MPSMGCECGYVFALGRLPVAEGYSFCSEAAENELLSTIEQLVNEVFNSNEREELRWKLGLAIGDYMQQFYKCPQCGRLIFFWEKDLEVGQSYIPESGV